MRLAHSCARVLPIPKNDNRVMVSPADADQLILSLKHVSCFESEYVDVRKILTSLKHISCLVEGLADFREQVEESRTLKRGSSPFYRSRTQGDNLAKAMGVSKCDDECPSSSNDYSDMQGDSTWGPEPGEEVEISSEKYPVSSRSGDEVNSKKVTDHDDGSESGEGRPEGKYKCSVCGVLHMKPSLLKQHMCTHSEDRSFICPVENCGRQYKRQDHLNRHSLTHKDNLFVCSWEGCDLTFNVNSNLQRHLRLHEKWGSNLLRGSKRSEACLTCPEPGCGKSFKYPSLLQTHTVNVHEALSVTQAICMEHGCGEIFSSPQLLKIHTKAAHSFVFCGTCGVSMLKRNLVAHARKHEEGQELIRCPHPGCLHSYSKKSNLDTHIRAIHMDLKPYACSHAGCEMRFAYRAVRDKHELCSVHVKLDLEGDFETEDSEFRLTSRGGRKRLMLEHVDDLLPRKYRSHPLE
ncbi:hypothetical protein M758_4G237300 [Ceratodon purpureus]|nr:hypothetical protein M758_4G237300 [Ceratodon purpureus]